MMTFIPNHEVLWRLKHPKQNSGKKKKELKIVVRDCSIPPPSPRTHTHKCALFNIIIIFIFCNIFYFYLNQLIISWVVIFHPALLAVISMWLLFYVPKKILGNIFPHYPVIYYPRKKNLQCEIRGFSRAGEILISFIAL